MRRKKPLLRKTTVRRVNQERRAARFERCYGQRGWHIRRMQCIVPNCFVAPIAAAHVVSRGAGGTKRDLVPLCFRHHREQHDVGIKSFEEKYDLSLRTAAFEIAAQLDQQGVP